MAFNKCRFCENNNIQFVSYEGPFGPKYQVICNRCKNSTAEYLCKDDAFNAWNKRIRGKTMKTPKQEPSNCPKCGAKMKTGYACGEHFIFPIGIKGCSLCGNRKMRASEEQVLVEWESDVLWYMENCK